MTPAATQAAETPLDSALLDRALRPAADGTALELPPLPAIAVEVARLAAPEEPAAPGGADGGAGGTAAGGLANPAVALAQLIRRDVALASQVMRVANSALHARRSPIVSLQQAITWLGADEIRRIAYSFAVQAELFSARAFEAQMRALWRESIAAACLAQELARLKRRNVESAYLCGLLHRVGYAVILWRLARAAKRDALTPDPTEALARLASGFENTVGAQLAREWQLPAPVAACIAAWRAPDAAPQTHRIDVIELTVARALAAELLVTGELSGDAVRIEPAWLETLNLYPADIETLVARSKAIGQTIASYS